MSAETLRRAATELRATVNGAKGAPGMVADPDFKLAVADWLDFEAGVYENPNEGLLVSAHALRVATVYLGD